MLVRRLLALTAALGAMLGLGAPARAFPHVVQKGETLAQIAEKTYGNIEMEKLLVAANGLDAGGGIPIVPGLVLEIPATAHRRAVAGETWTRLADELLGDPSRSDVLALSNGSMPWLAPADGQELIIPYNLRYVVTATDSTLTIAYRFLGARDKAWMLDRYNHLHNEGVRRGEVVLVPLTDLTLTASGRAEAESAGALVRSQGKGVTREAQLKAEAELPALAAEVRGGRWTEAITRGSSLLGSGELTKPQVAAIQRALVEAYVALDATGLAESACLAWREADSSVPLDPIELSPKIVKACASAAGIRPVSIDGGP